MKCPSCDGSGEENGVVDFSNGVYCGPLTCATCKGTGLVTDEHMRRIIAGTAARKARLERGESLRLAARRKGVSALEISKFERGEV